MKNTARGAISSNDVFGINVPKDSFYDSYREEALACGDIIEEMGRLDGQYVSITIDKRFLKNLIHSHLLFIKSRE